MLRLNGERWKLVRWNEREENQKVREFDDVYSAVQLLQRMSRDDRNMSLLRCFVREMDAWHVMRMNDEEVVACIASALQRRTYYLQPVHELSSGAAEAVRQVELVTKAIMERHRNPTKEGGTATPAQTNSAVKGRRADPIATIIDDVGEAVTKDPLYRILRDWLAKLQPLMPEKDAKKKADEVARSVVKDGLEQGVLKVLEGVTGKSPTSVPDDRNQTGPAVSPLDFDQKIFHFPKVPIPEPKPPARTAFQYLPEPYKTYRPGARIKFKLIQPDNFKGTNKRVVVVRAEKRNERNAERLISTELDSDGPWDVELTAPEEPEKYAVRVEYQPPWHLSVVAYGSVREFEVTGPKK